MEFCATCLQRDADDWYSLCVDELGSSPFPTLTAMLDAMQTSFVLTDPHDIARSKMYHLTCGNDLGYFVSQFRHLHRLLGPSMSKDEASSLFFLKLPAWLRSCYKERQIHHDLQ